MYIPPNSTIEVFTGVKLDKSYQQTIYFANEGAQNTFFSNNSNIRSGLLMTLIDSQFVRHTANTIRVAKNVNTLLTANYMRFFNPEYSNGDSARPSGKWFYCFVDSVEYVNEETTLVSYTVDVMQTWFVGATPYGYIERQHINSNDIWDSVVTEPFNFQPTIVISQMEDINFPLGYCMIVGSVPEYVGGEQGYVTTPANPQLVNNSVAGVALFCYNRQQVINDFLGSDFTRDFLDITSRNGNVIGIITMPEDLVSEERHSYQSGEGGATYKGYKMVTNAVISKITPTTTFPSAFGEYTPINKKLYTSQFIQCVVNNNRGNELTLQPELFNSLKDNLPNISFTAVITPSLSPSITLKPYEYGGVGVSIGAEECFRIGIDNYPTGIYTVDSYLSWRNQNRSSIDAAYQKSALTLLSSSYAGTSNKSLQPIVGGAISAYSSILSIDAKISDMQCAPDRTSGNSSDTGGYNFATYTAEETTPKNSGFRYYCRGIREEEAQIVDNFLSRYGYAYNREGTPLMFSAQKRMFYYIKMGVSYVNGNIPNDPLSKIYEIFNNGITFWNKENYGDMGEYSQRVFSLNVPTE